jgi:hypothetical protein
MSTAVIGLIAVDPTAPFARTADPALLPREGWDGPVEINLDTSFGRVAVPAMIKGELAVHNLVRDKGWTITVIQYGQRIHFGGRVFARADDAMAMAERMMSAHARWRDFFDHTAPDIPMQVREAINGEYQAAERRGEILRDRVF